MDAIPPTIFQTNYEPADGSGPGVTLTNIARESEIEFDFPTTDAVEWRGGLAQGDTGLRVVYHADVSCGKTVLSVQARWTEEIVMDRIAQQLKELGDAIDDICELRRLVELRDRSTTPRRP